MLIVKHNSNVNDYDFPLFNNEKLWLVPDICHSIDSLVDLYNIHYWPLSTSSNSAADLSVAEYP